MVRPSSVLAPHLDEPLGTVARPLWRGRLHAFTLVAMVPLMALLVVSANGAKARATVVIYALGLCSMLAASATYHRWVHALSARAWWRKADHAMIFAAIAGTFTPLCVLGAPNWLGVPLLVLMWVGGCCGAVMKFVGWRHARIVGGILYMGLGWAGAAAIPAIWQRVGVWPAVLVMIGGAFYTVGAIWFNRQWPRLRPTVFSYHEVWHACTVVAAVAHLGAVWIVAT